MEQLEKRETIDLDNPDDVDYLFRFSMTAERIVIQQRAEITQLLAELAAANEAKRELICTIRNYLTFEPHDPSICACRFILNITIDKHKEQP